MLKHARFLIIGSLASAMIGCTAPAPQVALESAIAALDIVSVLPAITPADRAWIAAASDAMACSAGVLGNKETPTQEANDIAKCVASLPVVPDADKPYIQAAISIVKIFTDLYLPVPAPPAVEANKAIRKAPAKVKTAINKRMAEDADKALAISVRVKARTLVK